MKLNGIAVVAVLISSALTVTKDASAQMTLLAANQPAGRLQNIIVDGSNVDPTYHFRGVATDDGQIDFGNDGSGQSTIPSISYVNDVTSITSTPDSTPSPPTANPATFVASNSFRANWSIVAGATGYRLDVSLSGSFGTYVAGYQNLNVGNVTNRNVIGLNASTTYYYRVRAYNGMGTSGNSNTVVVSTLSATGPPVVINNPATNVGSFSATLNGTVDPHALSTTVYFQYGTTTNYGSRTVSQIKTGNTYQNVTANISGLAASTTYHFRIVAMNNGGTRYGVDRILTTLSATGPPVAITNPATYIASLSARLNSSVYPHGLAATVHFEYGTTSSYGHTTANQSKTGNTYQSVVANIGGLAASTTYHFRIVAMNSGGTRYGVDRTFSTLNATGPPVAITNPAMNVAISSAGLNGTVNPHGLPTTVRFQYGTTASYGNTTTNQSMTGNAYQNMAANISGLAPSTVYHFRTVAMNSGGTRNGIDRIFTTTATHTPTPTSTPTPTPNIILPTPSPTATYTPTVSPTPTPGIPTATPTPTAGYVINQIGDSIVPGTMDTGNHGDDLVTMIALPFSYSLYEQTFNAVNLSSNGNVQLTTTNTDFTNLCLPWTNHDFTIFPYWNDLRTDNLGWAGCAPYPGGICGIYTSVSGTAPNRILNIEWRAVYYANTAGQANYELRLYEGQFRFDVIYGTVDQGNSSATAGVQRHNSYFTQYFCNGSGGAASGGQSYTFGCCR